jgi:ribonucleoside-diphosphate reductase alpha chain
MSIKALAEYTLYAKYSKFIKEKKRRETWAEIVERVFNMHKIKLGDKFETIKDDFNFAKEMVLHKKILGSQRALQFGGDAILSKMAKIYNCTMSYLDREDFFKECAYLLLCGCGTGFSVQQHHIDKLPQIKPRTKGKKTFIIPDSVEGWSDAFGVLMNSFFDTTKECFIYDLQSNLDCYSGYEVEFDYSIIRPKGSPISWGGIAPGYEPLKNSIDRITELLNNLSKDGPLKLKPINAYDIVMHLSDAIIAGGQRRSATICLFSPTDTEMINAKVGDWFIKNPQRGRSNNSVLLIRDKTSKEQFTEIMKSVKQFGEPGFIWADNTEVLVNPCSEIFATAYDENGQSGWNFCNLCEINGKKMKTEQEFYDACKAASIIGTIQASYDTFDYLTKSTESIVKKEALLGISMTGIMDSPEICLNPSIQRKGAKVVLDTNEKIAKILNINPCARSLCIKPAGSTSCILGTSSGIHPHHAKRYLRRVQANKMEFPVKYFAKQNPTAVEESVWSNNNSDLVINFLCEVPDGAITKNNIGAMDLLKNVLLTQKNWIEFGTRHERLVDPSLRHSVSNTISVNPNEWEEVENFIYENRQWLAGVSLLPSSGDLDFPQAPFVKILNEKEIIQTYGEGSLFASGLVVDGLFAFNNNLWVACDCALGIGETIEELPQPTEPIRPAKNGYTDKQHAAKLVLYANALETYYDDLDKFNKERMKLDWIRRFKQFAERYVNNDLRKCSHLLKHVSLWKRWLDLKRGYQEVDWTMCYEEDYRVDVTTLGATACGGKGCELK